MVNLPIVNAPYLSVNGLEISIVSNSLATINAGRARNSTNESDIILNSTVTLNTANRGLNGIDTGVITVSILYSLYLIGDSSLNNEAGVILSFDDSSPLLPAGYDMFRKIGYLRSDNAAHLTLGYFSGSSNERVFTYDSPQLTLVTAGNATSYTAVALTAGGSSLVPLVQNTLVTINYDFNPGAASRNLRLTSGNGSGGEVTITGQVASVHVTGNAQLVSRVNSDIPLIYYAVSNSGDAVAITVGGYRYTI